MSESAIALVPARAGSVRVRGKNIAPLRGHPLMAYSIAAARASGRFDAVVCLTHSEGYAAIASRYGADVVMRPESMAGSTRPTRACAARPRLPASSAHLREWGQHHGTARATLVEQRAAAGLPPLPVAERRHLGAAPDRDELLREAETLSSGSDAGSQLTP